MPSKYDSWLQKLGVSEESFSSPGGEEVGGGYEGTSQGEAGYQSSGQVGVGYESPGKGGGGYESPGKDEYDDSAPPTYEGRQQAMQPDCRPVRGKVPGPANHLLCSTHGHVLDVSAKSIIANSVAEYVKLGYGGGKAYGGKVPQGGYGGGKAYGGKDRKSVV